MLSCAFVVLTLTAAETQLTKGFSLSPAATPRHSAVASGKATDFPSARAMCEEGWRVSMLPTTTATTLSATTSIPRTGGGSAAPAVLQKLGHPRPPLCVLSPRIWYGSRECTCASSTSLYVSVSISVHLSIFSTHLSIYLSIQLSIYQYISIICRSFQALSTHDTFFPPISSGRPACDCCIELHYHCSTGVSALGISYVTINR